MIFNVLLTAQGLLWTKLGGGGEERGGQSRKMIGVAGAVFGYLRTQTLKAELCPSTFLLLPCLAAAGQDSLEPRVHLLSLAVCAPST